MTNEECFAVWAPELNPWSRWAKPALFCGSPASVLPPSPAPASTTPPASTTTPASTTAAASTTAPAPAPLPVAPAPVDLSWVEDARSRTAAIVELPGVEAVRAGLELARRGYRPVPLFNTSVGPSPLLDAGAIAAALVAGADELRDISMPPDAPPAFLLDSERTRPAVTPAPGRYDNRWIVFPQDFPSSNYLQAAGIGEVMLIQREPSAPADDLAHVLLRWQQGGIQIVATDPAARGRTRSLTISTPSRFRRAWYRLMAAAGLRRNDAGGFGAMIPLITASSGYS